MTRTPGDWKFDPFACGFIIVKRPGDGRDLYLAQIVDEDDEGLFEPDEEKRLANGRLMAAAPEMLETLEQLVFWGRNMGGWESPCWDKMGGWESPCWDKAEKLLKEVQGG